ncbi:MAG: fluoride efflux transporter CrcB [Actinomycetota bacterium]|nr:fluoride efflux transporter CrcB [Actinomycetota bacterium]
MEALTVAAVALGGFVGAPARFLADRLVADHVESDFPIGTFLVNVTGSFLLGVLTGLDLAGHLPALVTALVGTGFCGAYTTFSTWSFETVRLVEDAEYLEAALNVVASLAVGLVAAGAGIALGLLR